jgi:hypothetical protein
VTPHGFCEDQLVEQPALEVLKALGWAVDSAGGEGFRLLARRFVGLIDA